MRRRGAGLTGMWVRRSALAPHHPTPVRPLLLGPLGLARSVMHRPAPDLGGQLFLSHDAIFILIRGIEKLAVSHGEIT